MSTADSRLHICAVMISYDILPVIWPKYFKKHPSCISYYRIADIAILFVAMLSIGTALMSSDLWLIGSVINGYIRWYVPIIVAPFILAVLGFRTSTTAALIGMATGGIAVCTWRTWIYPLVGTDNSSFVCMLINGLAMLAAHYILPRSKKHIVNLDEGFEKIKQCYNRKVTNRISG